MNATSLQLSDAPVPSVHQDIEKYQAFLEANAGLHKVGEKTHCAVGYGGNINFIEGDDAVIVINTGSFVEWAAEAQAEFRKICSKPIAAVMYTHGYSDHTGGVRALVPKGREEGVEVYASAVWRDYVGQATSPMQPEVILRAAAQLGWLLPKGIDGSMGSILARYMPRLGSTSYLAPTRDIAEPTTVTISGVTLELLAAPHDVDDGMIVWMPDEKILFSGDTLMPAAMYPPIATPRFEPRRDPQIWVHTMGLAGRFGADHLIPAYGLPFHGAERVKASLTGQQKIAQYMIDETNRLTLQGMTAHEIAATVKLPEELCRDIDYNELYHRFSWIIRSLISREFGWFSGDALDYVRHAPRDRAFRLAREFGGPEKLLERAAAAYREGDFAWSLELATEVLLLDGENAPARQLRLDAQRALAYGSNCSNERNFLLTSVAIEDGSLDRDFLLRAFRGKEPRDTDLLRPAARLLDLMGPKLRRDAALRNGPLRVRFIVSDTGERLDFSIADGVMLRGPDPDRAEPDLELRLDYGSLIRGVEAMTPFTDLRDAGSVQITRGDEYFDRLIESYDW